MIPSVRFDEIYTTNTYLYFASNIWVPSFARCRLTNDNWKTKRFCEINATKFGSENETLHTIIYHHMTSYGYMIMIIVDSCMIWFNFDCIMHLKKLYHIVTNVCSRKSATTFVIALTDKAKQSTKRTTFPFQCFYSMREIFTTRENGAKSYSINEDLGKCISSVSKNKNKYLWAIRFGQLNAITHISYLKCYIFYVLGWTQ